MVWSAARGILRLPPNQVSNCSVSASRETTEPNRFVAAGEADMAGGGKGEGLGLIEAEEIQMGGH